MSARVLMPRALTADRFSPFGEVIAARPETRHAMNAGRFDRFCSLAHVDDAGRGTRPTISLARARTATVLPYSFQHLERHPFGSQAFVPLSPFRFLVVAAPAGESLEASMIEAFVTDGHQGVNYHPGVWHMPLIALQAGQEFLIIDHPANDNCEERRLARPVWLRLED